MNVKHGEKTDCHQTASFADAAPRACYPHGSYDSRGANLLGTRPGVCVRHYFQHRAGSRLQTQVEEDQGLAASTVRIRRIRIASHTRAR